MPEGRQVEGAPADAWVVAVSALQLADRLVDAIQVAVARAGFPGVTPIHGFVFTHIGPGGATTASVATYLGVTKQAGAQLVERLVRDGLVERIPNPADLRSRHLRLTERARSVTEVAERAACDEVEQWREEVGATAGTFERALLALTAQRSTVRQTSR